MRRHRILLLILISAALSAACAAAGVVWTTIELADRVKAHINERMYDTCKSVVLERHREAVYRGHAEFLNGVKIDLEVTTADNLIEYRFLKRQQHAAHTTPPKLSDLKMLLARRDAEIARLRALCRQAGIDPNATLAQAAPRPPVDADDPLVPFTQDATITVRENQETPVSESPIFTWQLYHMIQKGMSYPRVVELLGHEGQMISSSDFDGAVNDIFVWTNPDDSHICVVFRNGKALVRTQHALPDTTDEPQIP